MRSLHGAVASGLKAQKFPAPDGITDPNPGSRTRGTGGEHEQVHCAPRGSHACSRARPGHEEPGEFYGATCVFREPRHVLAFGSCGSRSPRAGAPFVLSVERLESTEFTVLLGASVFF